MTIEVNVVEQPKPPREFIIRLNDEEMRNLMEVANWHGFIPAYVVNDDKYSYGASARGIWNVCAEIWHGVGEEVRKEFDTK